MNVIARLAVAAANDPKVDYDFFVWARWLIVRTGECPIAWAVRQAQAQQK